MDSDLIELKKIRDYFQNDLREWFDIAHTLIAITSLGSWKVIEYMQSNSDASYSFAVPIAVNGSLNLASLNKLSYEKMFQTYHNHKGAIAELVYERLIQRWYDFLSQIIEQIVKYHITGVKSYPKIPKVKIEVNFSDDKFLEQFPTLIKDSFDFQKNIEKTKLIEDCLEQKIDDEFKQQIKKAIITRNLLEHSQGIIRTKDTKDLGINSIKLIDDHCVEKEFKVGERVEITIYELFRLKQAFYNTSKILIPEQ
ncbi:MAG: hypothetical protein ACR2LR_02285 [Hassallia sp.]